ncbi:RHS repeat domain-containing protein, partial [Verrucomicrobiota bacterium]
LRSHPSTKLPPENHITGLLTQKQYADGSSVNYTYTTEGKLATRTWARGETTIYSYDSDTGVLLTVDYSDTTPDIAYTYNRMGQQATVTDVVGTRTFAYISTFQPESETITGGNGYVLSRTYDSLGRSSGFALDSGYSVEYGYDTVGRLNNVGWDVATSVSDVSYSYLPNSDLISGYTESGSGLSLSKTYEANRNLVAEIRNEFGTNLISQYTYANDELGRRTSRSDSGSAFTGSTANAFAYNTRSELTNALMDVNGYAYDYDNIGNRESATNTTDGTLTYTANNLNQYTAISDGKTESLLYDLDGNLTDDGEWLYTWNAENRLILVEPVKKPKKGDKKLEFKYDYMGRRVRKTVSTFQKKEWSVSSESTFVYDGWNMVHEVVTTASGTTTNAFCWGIDLSGSLQGAGGIGGLLATASGTNAYFTCADANGNVTEYLDDQGTVAAHFEYGPYGGIIAKTGAKADDFVFLFSSKYLDQDTGLYYYGYRYYSPSLGRWLSRDPIEEEGASVLQGGQFSILLDTMLSSKQNIETLLYVFLRNQSISTYDPFGLRGDGGCKKCGAEIDLALVATRAAVERHFKALDPWRRHVNCRPWKYPGLSYVIGGIGPGLRDSIRAAEGWDMGLITWGGWKIHCGPGSYGTRECGTPDDCTYTVWVENGCYWSWDVNYLLLGWIGDLCNIPSIQLLGVATTWKYGMKSRDPNKGQAFAFAMAGRAGYPYPSTVGIPRPPDRYKDCKNCGYVVWGGAFKTLSSTWPHYNWW